MKNEKIILLEALIEALKNDGEAWRFGDNLPLIKWLVKNNYTFIESKEDLIYMLDNMNTCNLELLTFDNIDNYFNEDLKRITNKSAKQLKALLKADNSNGFILHYPKVFKYSRERYIVSDCIYYNLSKAKREPKKEVFVAFGGLWFDSINGNTYHATKILKVATNEIYFTRFQYGYGSQYLTSAKEYIENELKIKNYSLLNMGYGFYKKQQLKNRWF